MECSRAQRTSHPSFYPIEKSSVFVPQVSAQTLAYRIASVLQARSTSAAYDDQKAKVYCVSSSGVEFCIRLYRGRAEYKHGIIVEVQRQSGFDLGYTQDVYAILDAAEGKDAKILSVPMASVHHYEDIDENSLSDDEEDLDSLEDTAGFTSLKVISDILCPQDKKAQVTVEGRDFALSSLASLTSVERMGKTAVHFTNELVSSEEYASLRHVLFSNVGPSTRETPQRSMILSLEILANAAKSSRSSTSLADVLSQKDYMDKLVFNIENAALNPRAADLSCVIIKNTYDTQAKEACVPLQYRERLQFLEVF